MFGLKNLNQPIPNFGKRTVSVLLNKNMLMFSCALNINECHGWRISELHNDSLLFSWMQAASLLLPSLTLPNKADDPIIGGCNVVWMQPEQVGVHGSTSVFFGFSWEQPVGQSYSTPEAQRSIHGLSGNGSVWCFWWPLGKVWRELVWATVLAFCFWFLRCLLAIEQVKTIWMVDGDGEPSPSLHHGKDTTAASITHCSYRHTL